MAKPSFKFDPRGVCLLCLTSKNCQFLNEWNEDVDSRTSTAFKMLLRYIQVEVGVVNQATLHLLGEGLKNDGLMSLCEDCSQVANDFLELYQDFENIRLQLDVCVGQLYEFMEAGGQDPGRVREFERLINSGEREDQNGARIMKALRQELIDKVCRKVRGSFPRISMGPKLKLKESDGKRNITNPSLAPVCLQNDLEERPFREPEKRVSAEEESLATTDLCCDITADEADKGPGNPSGTSGIVQQDLSSGESRKDSSVPLDAANSELETTQQWTCIYCNIHYSAKNNLVTHQLQKHAKSFLSDEGSLPPHISEQELNEAVGLILNKLNPRQLQCRFCKNKIFANKSDARIHLLRMHLENVLENFGRGDLRSYSRESGMTPSSYGKRVNCKILPLENAALKCVHCGKSLSRKQRFEEHNLTKHTAAFVTEKGLLPIGIAETQINSSLATILREAGNQCPFCKTTASRLRQQRKIGVKRHLLMKHLPQIMERIKELSLANGNQASFSAPGRIPHLKLVSRTKVLPSSIKRRTKMRFTSNPRVPVKQLCGPHLEKDTDIWKCIPCRKRFSSKSNLQTHQLKIHPKTVLKKKVPPSIPEESLITAADRIAMRVCKKMGDGQSQRKYKCVLCNNSRGPVDHWYLRVHVLRCHLDEVIQELEVGEKVKQS